MKEWPKISLGAQLAPSILQKKPRIAEILGNIRSLLAKHGE